MTRGLTKEPERREGDRAPTPVAGVDLRALPIGPEEAFVMSRVDGRASEAELAASTGLTAARVREALERLASLGAVRLAASASVPPRTASPPGSQRLPRQLRPQPPSSPPTGEEAPPASPRRSSSTPPLYDPAELQEAADLPEDRKKRILDTFYRLDSVDYYQLLGVERDAPKKVVKEAYYAVVAIFHPDRYYGKDLGSFKNKLERVFQRLTEAQETLTRKRLRADYDRYLQSQQATRALDRLDDARLQDAEAERLRRQLEREALEAEQIRSSMLPPAPPSESSHLLRRDSSPTLPQLDSEARRQILARKLAGAARSSVLPARPPAPPTPSTAPARARHEAAAEGLRDRYERRLAHLRAEQVRRHVDAAEDALGQGNFVAAANSLRLALSLEPNRPQLAERLEAAQRSASAQLADQYLEQAKYEERQGHLDRAARSYERAARGRPSAALFHRAAQCYLDGGLDLKQASHLAKQAVALAPQDAPPRVTLARIYIEAGMAQSALSELERAQELNPSDDGTIKELMKRARRG